MLVALSGLTLSSQTPARQAVQPMQAVLMRLERCRDLLGELEDVLHRG